MRYVGSKSRISKEIVPIIQGHITSQTVGYLEPFVGGANIIDKVKHDNKIGCDIHEELIALLRYAQSNELPEFITEAEYKAVKNNKNEYEKWYVGLVGFCASFGAKYFAGYARESKGDNSGIWSRNAINNLRKQVPNIIDVKFVECNFLELSKEIKNYVIYCDIPYRNTTKYSTDTFPYEDFYKWAKGMAEHNTVLISEYDMPDGFTCIWEKEIKTSLGGGINKNSDKKRIERLFICD